MERVAASHKLHVLVARRLIVGKVLPPIDGHLEPRLPFVDQDLCKEAIIPAVTAIFRVMSRVELCAVGLPTTRTCAQQCCARGVVPEHWCWAIVVGTTHGGQESVAFAPFGWGATFSTDFVMNFKAESHVLPDTCLAGTNLHAEVLGCLNG